MVAALVAAAALAWQPAPPLPLARSEVAGAAVGREVAVAGGFLADGGSSARVDAFAPARGSWRRLADLPLGVNHAMAAAYRGRLYVVGGYNAGRPLTAAYVLAGGRWRALPRLPQPRAAGGAAVVNGRLYVVGGVGANGLARGAYALDLRRRSRWRAVPGPTPREHLGVVALRGRIYAAGGRTAGFDTNLALLEAYRPGARRWSRRAPLPQARGGTGLAAVSGRLVSVGGEQPQGTIAGVYAYLPSTNRWQRLPDLPTPRHGLAVIGLGGRVYAVGGGIRPGLSTSSANEVLPLGP